MKIPVKKLKNGFEMPVYGLGTWQMGGRHERDIQNDDKADIKAIQSAIELGITHIDTAEAYAGGYAETLISKAIKGYDRTKLLLASKVLPENLRKKDVIRSAKASLLRLKTDYLDLYLIHRFNPAIPLEETMEAMGWLVDQGLVHNIGVCNFNQLQFQAAQDLTRHKLVVNQIHYNLIYREAEQKGLIDYCQSNDIFLMAWRPLEYGILAGGEEAFLKNLSKKYLKTPSQIAINWLISKPNIITLAKTSNVEHLKENLGGMGWTMEKEDYRLLDKDFPGQQNSSKSYL